MYSPDVFANGSQYAEKEVKKYQERYELLIGGSPFSYLVEQMNTLQIVHGGLVEVGN